ncbi:hypothetical protein [Rhodococcus sp. PD04]|uniref:hypothetical protein n=1 Tax=Rhodococcus sp. PD04 TaxID=3109594 RepID=UPI002DD9BD82|nr:hypothetical protein [Rhodococcus sp. PD04]WSE22327.1 hypothetical protein U9J23_22175 [Rhodococcus sp. PD04]
MNDQIRVPGDPAKAVRDFLRDELPALVGDVRVALELPEDWTPSSDPAVIVFDDGGISKAPVYDAPRVRVTVWAAGRTRSREIAGVCRGMLGARSVPGVARISDPSTLLSALDPQNKGTTTSFHAKAVVRTIAL